MWRGKNCRGELPFVPRETRYQFIHHGGPISIRPYNELLLLIHPQGFVIMNPYKNKPYPLFDNGGKTEAGGFGKKEGNGKWRKMKL
jgi:hypothetical protein